MGKTTTNESRAIVHIKSDHTAESDGKSDKCRKLDLTIGSWKNTVASKKLTLWRTSNTFIQNAAICKKSTWIGPLSDPAHPGILLGTKSFTYRFQANATSFSSNCIIEGEGVVRSDDKTTQNNGNCDGKVSEGKIVASLESGEEEAERICNIAEIEGVSDFSGRKLGYPTDNKEGLPSYLDVYTPATVTINTVRRDITGETKGDNPECPMGGKHTSWLATWKVFPFSASDAGNAAKNVAKVALANQREKVEMAESGEAHIKREVKTKEHNGEEFKVVAEDAINEWLVALGGFKGNPGNNGGKTNESEAEWDSEAGEQVGGAQDRGQGYGGDRDAEWMDKKAAAADKPGADIKPMVAGPKRDNGVGPEFKGKNATLSLKQSPENIKRIILWFYWYWNAPQFNVTATACAAARQITLRVLPYQRLKIGFDLNTPKLSKYARRKVKEKAQSEQQWANDGVANNTAAAKQVASDAKQAITPLNRKKQDLSRNRKTKDSPHYDKQQQKRRDLNKKIRDIRAQEKRDTAPFERKVKFFEAIVSTLKRCKDLINVLQKFASMAKVASAGAGADIEFKTQFLEGFGLEIATSYQPCGDKRSQFRGDFRSKSRLGLKWEIRVEAEPLLGVEGRVYISVFSFLPMAGPAVSIARRLGLRADIWISAAFGVDVNVGFDKDPDDFITASAPTIQFNLNISGGIIISAVVVSIHGTIRIPTSAAFTFHKPSTESNFFDMGIEGKVNVFAEATLNPDGWISKELYNNEIKRFRANPKLAPFPVLNLP